MRLVERPTAFSGREDDWQMWKHRLRHWMQLVDVRYPEAMDMVAQRRVGYALSEEAMKMSAFLYSVLMSLTSGKSLQLVVGEQEHGWHAWYALCEEFEPRIARGKVALASMVMAPKLTVGDFEEALVKWEVEVVQYETLTGRPYDRDELLAILMERAPKEVKDYLLQAMPASYEEAKRQLTAYFLARRRWGDPTTSTTTRQVRSGDGGGPPPMDIGSMMKEVTALWKEVKGWRPGYGRGDAGITYGSKGDGSKGYGDGSKGHGGVKGGKMMEKGGRGGTTKGPCFGCGRMGHRVNECWAGGRRSMKADADPDWRRRGPGDVQMRGGGKTLEKGKGDGGGRFCYWCGKPGHFARECKAKGKGKKVCGITHEG